MNFEKIIQKHLCNMVASPLEKPATEDYFYQCAKNAYMERQRALSANPIPSYPTESMIFFQKHYAIRLGDMLHCDSDCTEMLINWAYEILEENPNVNLGDLASLLQQDFFKHNF